MKTKRAKKSNREPRKKKIFIKGLKIDGSHQEGPYYYRQLHIFFKNECVFEIGFTGYLHEFKVLANIGEMSFHIEDAYNNFDCKPKKKGRHK